MGLTIPTYVRTADLSKYLDISKDKGAWTEFIHNALNPEFVAEGSAPDIKEVQYYHKGKPLVMHVPTDAELEEELSSENPIEIETNGRPVYEFVGKPKPIKTPITDSMAKIPSIVELCKHGADPSMCKYAKFVNGKKICK